MPLAANALTTLEAVRSYLKLRDNETNDNSLLEELINGCSSAIENYCKRKFKEQTFEEDYDGTGKNYLLLEQFPVKVINVVLVDDVPLDPGEYKVKKNNGVLIRKKFIWPQGDINISVTYTAGLSDIPSDLELACKHFVKSYFQSDIASYSTTFQDGFVFRPEALPAQVKALVAPYKKVF